MYLYFSSLFVTDIMDHPLLKWLKRKLWLGMIIWWLVILRMLFTSIPNDQNSHEARKSSDLIPPSRVKHIVKPESANTKCAARIETNLRKVQFKECGVNVSCPTFSCLDLINGDVNAQRKASSSAKFTRVIRTDKELLGVARNCDHLFEYGKYIMDVGSEDELNFPLAYSILVYKDAGQVELLLRSIYQPNNAYCFHIDQKASPLFKKTMEYLVKCFPNVVISSRSVRVVYAGFSRLYADILCMKDLVKSKHHWTYLINLAGTAMPLKTNWEIVQILSMYNGSNDIEGLPLNRTIHNRFSHKWVITNSTTKNNLIRTNTTKSPPPHQLTIVRGSAYGAFSRSFVDFVLTDNIAKDLLEWSVDTYSPDEHYWATLHYVYYNPQLKTPGGFKGPAEQGTWISSYSSWPTEEPCLGLQTSRTSPCVFGIHALPHFIHRPELFVNKLSMEYEPLAQVCLAASIQLRSRCQTDLLTNYYINFSFIKNRELSVH